MLLDPNGYGIGMQPGIGHLPRVKEPESVMVPGMSAVVPRPAPQRAMGEIWREGGASTRVMVQTQDGPRVLVPDPPNLPFWNYDFDPATGSARASWNGEVVMVGSATLNGSALVNAAGAVASFNTRTGAVVLTGADVTGVNGVLNSGAPVLNQIGVYLNATTLKPVTPAAVQTTTQNPAALTGGAVIQMFGLGAAGSASVITPTYSSRVRATFNGVFSSTSIAVATMVMSFGTGAAPANRAAFAGTQIGSTNYQVNVTAANANNMFAMDALVTGLTPGTQYWFDLGASAAAGNAFATAVVFSAFEM